MKEIICKCFHTTMLPLQVALAAILSIVVVSVSANPADSRQLALGLYNNSDKVTILTSTNFKETIVQQNRSAIVEFYNSYCGHCKRFAPFYKKLAEDLYPWRDVLPVCALDCAAEENNDICREYEVMGYPSLRYIGPNFEPGPNNYGEPVETQDINEIRVIMANSLAMENSTAKMSAWPNLKSMTMAEAEKPFEGLNSNYKLVIIVQEPENSTAGIETALRYQRWTAIQIRRVKDADVAAKLKMHGNNRIVAVDRKGDIAAYETPDETVEAYEKVIDDILKVNHYSERPETRITTSSPVNQLIVEKDQDKQKEILDEVKRNKHIVYQADLEMAIRTVLFNEIPKHPDINGESLLALQRFLNVLKKYNPLGANGRTMIGKLQEFVVQSKDGFSGQVFETELRKMEELFSPIFSSNQFIGCTSSRPGFRGFTCSLWQLFHFMSVQSANSNTSTDPLEVLQAMHGYVKHYFGCTECSEHFQSMASKRQIWNVPDKDEAILWLWAAHNEVNQRLTGDETEDPLFPKIQFPSRSSCEQCYKDPKQSSENLQINWNKDAVLSFLKNIHNPQFISRYGISREEVLSPSLEKLRSKRMVSNIFTDMDMRMGMLLYGFCIIMMVVAFKLFAYKGYRKKPYCHDMLGKV